MPIVLVLTAITINFLIAAQMPVKAHLISRGIDPNKIIASGKGETEPVTGNTCHGHGKALKECLAPDRRVDIDVEGMK